jgi:hypothetical protein
MQSKDTYYPFFTPELSDPRWLGKVQEDPSFSDYIWIVPPCRPFSETNPNWKKADRLRDCVGFASKNWQEKECVLLYYQKPNELKLAGDKIENKLFKKYENIALQTKNETQLFGLIVPIVPSRYYKKISEKAKWNTFLTDNLVGNISIGTKIPPDSSYLESSPKFIPFKLTTMTKIEFEFDIAQQNMTGWTTMALSQSTAFAGDTAFDVTYYDGATEIHYVYMLMNTSTLMYRQMVI